MADESNTSDFVVSANVWIEVDKPIASITSVTEIDCIQLCREWLRSFIQSSDRLVVDITYKIILEYRNNISQQGSARQWLNQLETQPRNRLVELEIEWDNDQYAVVPESCAGVDASDRKFVAVALAHQPTPPIINAVDTDWDKSKAQLDTVGIIVREICSAYIQERLSRR
jgi:hypothetical protein